VANGELRLAAPDGCLPPLAMLIDSCTQQDPDKRPNFREIHQTIMKWNV